ncbi:hypothetical protein BJX61DRAFT_421826 [Aspergillus egyptiacus]|nr:hypothetical protein BJX61DRAFT_421826 [Aspergillus egyptiacus]
MSTGPPVWSAQDEYESRSPAETRTTRRSRRKKDDAETDRKEPTKPVKSKEKDSREKERDKEEEINKESFKDKEKDHDKEKEPKRANRRQRDKSSSTSNIPMSTQSTASHPRKKPKLESPEQKVPDTAPAASTAASTAPSESVPAPTTAAPAPATNLSPQITSTPSAAHATQPQPQLQQQQPRPPNSTSHLLLSQPNLPHLPTTATTSSYPTMVSAPPSRPQSQPLAPPQRTSGQNYDPIRSAFDTTPSAPAPTAPASASFSPPPRPVSPRPFRASASPAISSIIDPPQNNSDPSPSQYVSRPYNSPSRGISSYPPTPAAHTIGPTHAPLPPSSSPYGRQSPYGPPQAQPSQETHISAQVISPEPPVPSMAPGTPSATQVQQASTGPTPMDVDNEPPALTTAEKALKRESKPSTAVSSKPPSPRSRPAKEAPPLPQGSGLISNALFGSLDDSASDASSNRTPNIIVHIPLKGHGNQIVNFARLAEEQYGFAALHPRLAAHKERMARVAAAGAALERNDRTGRGISAGESADEDLSLDVDRDSELDGELTVTATQAPETTDGKKRRRRRKMEEYDRDDPFVDDSEMVWQEQAAASKDGFFVYSGPLVSEGEKVQVERYVPCFSFAQEEFVNVMQGGWHDQTGAWPRTRRA